MARRAGWLVERLLPPVVNVDIVRRVRGGLQLRGFRVARRATERGIDLVVAHQAIRHLRKVLAAHLFGFGQAAMTGHAGVLVAAKMPRGILGAGKGLGRREVRLLLNRRHEQRRQVPKFKVELMIEVCDKRRRGRLDLPLVLVALDARILYR